MIFSTQIKTFGLDISDQSLKIAQVVGSGHSLELASCHKIDLPAGLLENGEIKNEDELVKHIKKIVSECRPKIHNNYVVACLPEVKTFIKLINVKIKYKHKSLTKNILRAINKELPNHIPLPVETIKYDWQIIKQDKEHFEILIGIAPKDIVYNFSKLLKKAGLVPLALEIEAQSIIRAIFPKNDYYLKKPLLLKHISFEQILKQIKKLGNKDIITLDIKRKSDEVEEMKKEPKEEDKSIYFIIDFGASRSGLIVWADKTIKFTSSLKVSGENLTQTISQNLKIDQSKAEKLKVIYGLTTGKGKTQVKKNLQPVIDELCQEINKAKDFYQGHFSNEGYQYKIILTGGSANLPQLDSELAQRLNMPVEIANPLLNLTTSQPAKSIKIQLPNKFSIKNIANKLQIGNKIKLNQKEVQSYTTAIGLALRSHFIKDY